MSLNTNHAAIVETLGRVLMGGGIEPLDAIDQPTMLVARERLIETCRALRDTPGLQFRFLAELTAVDWWPREPRFEVVYQLTSLGVPIPGLKPGTSDAPPKRVRLKVRVAGDDAHVPTVSAIWPNANWLEREVWDFFGISFDGHPNLTRLLMPDDWEGHPLRKDHPVQINMAVKTYESPPLSQEAFRANIEADRESRRK